MRSKKTWWLAAACIAILVASSSALGSSMVQNKRFQRTFVCVNKHNGLIKVISRRQNNRCAAGWKRYRVSDIFGHGMRGARGIPGAAGPQGPAGPAGAAGARGEQGL
ncbi:MAG TPA: hypothetical protein VFJ75_00665, partial [Gaiellaceae bacterium]|nr:hypothetical protein [Gaiellaceae bacterium]